MIDLDNRLKLVEKYCSDEYRKLYYKLKDCKDKSINMDYNDYINEGEEHAYSNLYTCVYNFKKENNVKENMNELMQLMKDISFNVINVKCEIYNFKIKNNIK